jgi:hypothetical protein
MIILCGRCFSFEGFADGFAYLWKYPLHVLETLAMAEGNRDKSAQMLGIGDRKKNRDKSSARFLPFQFALKSSSLTAQAIRRCIQRAL